MGGREGEASYLNPKETPTTPTAKRDGLGMVYTGWRVKGAKIKDEFPEFQESQNGTEWKLSGGWE